PLRSKPGPNSPVKAREGLSYAAAGVDIAAYEAALERVRPLIEAASGRIGEFAGTYELPGLGHLVASADGVGTKIKVAIALGRHRGIGADLVNHCVNDIAVMRARPLFFLDYFATGKLDPDVFEDVVAGIASACREAGAALLGGETAEMPGLYALGDYDLAGFIVGWVDAGRPASATASIARPGRCPRSSRRSRSGVVSATRRCSARSTWASGWCWSSIRRPRRSDAR